MVALQGLGDPTLIGWSVFFIYFVTAWLCYRASHSTDSGDPLAAAWLSMAVFLFLLGVNKQLDFQLWLSAVGRWLTKALGWYDQRFWIQLSVAITVSIVLLGYSLILVRWGWGHLWRIRVAVLGMSLLVTFVLMRVITFYVFDLDFVIAKVRIHEFLEVSGSVLIGVAAAAFVRSSRNTTDSLLVSDEGQQGIGLTRCGYRRPRPR